MTQSIYIYIYIYKNTECVVGSGGAYLSLSLSIVYESMYELEAKWGLSLLLLFT
jgi:hypothetical protein